MKVFAPQASPIINAFLIVFQIQGEQELTENIQEADFVLVADYATLREWYRPEKFFGFLPCNDIQQEMSKKQPENVFVMDTRDLFNQNSKGGVFAFVKALQNWKPVEKKPQRQFGGNIAQLSRSYFVLVIDDTEENLQIATERLPGQKLILARGPEEAMRYLNLEGEMPDAVLTDMQMRPDRVYGSLNVNQYGVTETIHSGFSMMFEATSRGIPVAIVTDGNHHLDWASAMFDRLTSAEVNGQKVLFFNNIGKCWDMALKMLLEPGEPVQE